MPTGQPDWWGATPRNEIASVGDMGELAVRLGGISVFTRSGNVIYYHSFDRGRAGWTDGNFGLATELLRDTYGIFGKLCYGITTDGDTSHNPFIWKSIFARTYGKTGNEWGFCMGVNSSYVEIVHEYIKDSYVYHAAVKWDIKNKTLYCYTPSGYVSFAANIMLAVDFTASHFAKMVCDLDNGYYDTFLLDNYAWDISDKAIYKTTSTGNYYNKFQFTYWSDPGITETIYFHYFIFTQDEP
jgi:hypothetical protein